MDRAELIIFRNFSTSGFRFRYFCKILQHCETGQYI